METAHTDADPSIPGSPGVSILALVVRFVKLHIKHINDVCVRMSYRPKHSGARCTEGISQPLARKMQAPDIHSASSSTVPVDPTIGTVPHSLRQAMGDIQAAHGAGRWDECSQLLQDTAQTLDSRTPGWENTLRAAALQGIWDCILGAAEAALRVDSSADAMRCVAAALRCAVNLAQAGRPIPHDTAQCALQHSVQCLLQQDRIAGSCPTSHAMPAPRIAHHAATVAAYALNTATKSLPVESSVAAELAQVCVQSLAVFLASVPLADPPVAKDLLLHLEGAKSNATRLVFPAGDYYALNNGSVAPTPKPEEGGAFVQLLLGLVRASDVPLENMLAAGAAEALLHAASLECDTHSTAVAALAALRSIVQLAVPQHEKAPPLPKEHRGRLHRNPQRSSDTTDKTNTITMHLLQAEMPSRVVALAQRHPNVWVRRAAVECLEACMYCPTLVASPPEMDARKESPQIEHASPPLVLCSAAPCRDLSLQRQLSWVQWATGGGKECLQINPQLHTGSLQMTEVQAHGNPCSGQYCVDVMRAAADADWLSGKWAKRAIGFWQRHRQN